MEKRNNINLHKYNYNIYEYFHEFSNVSAHNKMRLYKIVDTLLASRLLEILQFT